MVGIADYFDFFKALPKDQQILIGDDKGISSLSKKLFYPDKGDGSPYLPQTRLGKFGMELDKSLSEQIDTLAEAPAQAAREILSGISNVGSYLGGKPQSTIDAEKLIEKQKEKEQKFETPIVDLKNSPFFSRPRYFDDSEYEAMSGDIQEQLNQLQNNLDKKTGKATIDDKTSKTTDIDVRSPISPEQKLRQEEDEQKGVEGDTTKKDDQSDAFTEAMKSIEDISTGEDSGVKGLDYYKKQFADATGIDISGKADTRAAAIGFGLALMQNIAGKGFNVGRMLSAVGEAGEKALPLAESARKEARAAQVSAGTYALQERKAAIADAIDRQQKKIDAVLAIQKEFRGYENQKELERIKAATKIKVEALKQEAESLKNINDKKLEFTYKGFEISGKTEKTPVSTQKEMKVTTGIRKSDGQMVFPFAAQEASQFATGLGQLEKASTTLDNIEANLQEYIQNPNKSVTLDKAIEFGNDIVVAAFGSEYSVFKDENGKNIPGPIQDNKILQQRLISQFKRFLTQETGNGISKIDVENIERLLGDVNFFTNPAAAIKRIQEVRAIFDTPREQILTQLEQFSDPKRHLTDDAYKETIKIINDKAFEASKLSGKTTFDEGEYTRDDDGNIFIDLTNMAN